MPRGIIDKQLVDDKLVNTRICEMTCAMNEPGKLNDRKTSFLQLIAPNYLGEITSDVYEMEVETPYETSAVLAADIDDTVLTFALTPESFEVMAEDLIIMIGDEQMVIDTINPATNEITVHARAHGWDAASHTVDEPVNALVTMKASCQQAWDCRTPTFACEIENAPQRYSDCVSYCTDDLCRKIVSNCAVGKEEQLDTLIGKQKKNVIKGLLEGIDSTYINGSFSYITKDGKKVYSTRGLRQWAMWVTNGDCQLNAWLVYDVLAQDECQSAAAGWTGCLDHDVLERFYEAAWERVNPEWTHVIMNRATFLIFDKAADKCETCIAPGETPTLRHKFISTRITTPYGDIDVVINENMPTGEAIFFNLSDLGWYADCQINGQLYTESDYATNDKGNLRKIEIEGVTAFDASRNMCQNLATLKGFVKCPTCA